MDEADPVSSQPRPGAHPSAPSGSNYAVELPFAEELQALLEGRYIVESFLGQGGMGAVYKGLQMPLKRPVAIKILQKRQAAGEEDEFAFEERFKREAYAMASLTHPNIVQVYDCGDAGENFLFISMELLQGGDLSDAIKAGAVTTASALKWICQICDGLQAAHDRGIVHRDIKPANIFLTADGRAKVADFGLAKKFDVKSTFVTKTGLGMGTPDYAAPEQYEGAADIDHRADIYALGVMMYQMLTGKLPRGVYKTPSRIMPELDPRLDQVVGKAMANEREERWQSAGEIKDAIAGILTQPTSKPMPTVATRTSAVPMVARPATPMPARPTAQVPNRISVAPTTAQAPAPEKSSKGVIIGIIAAVFVIGAATFFFFNRGGKPSPGGTATGVTSSAVDDAFIKEVAAATPERQAELIDAKLEAINGAAVALNTVVKEGKISSIEVRQDGQGGDIRDFSALTALKDLKRLALYNLNPTDLGFLRGMKIDSLTIHGGSYSDVSVLRDLPLTSVEMRSNRVQDWSALAGKPLRLLDLMLTATSDISFVKGMPLTHLVLDRAKVTDLSPIRGLPLTDIQCDFVASRDTDILRSIPTLKRINDKPANEFWRSVGVTEAPPSTARQSNAGTSASSEVFSFGGHRYQIVKQRISWQDAKASAEAMGGHLATPSSKEEDEFIIAKTKDRMKGGQHLWIGLYRNAKAQNIQWVTNGTAPYRHWGPGKPDSNPDSWCGVGYLFRDAGGPADWDDVPGNDAFAGGFVVEWDGAGSTPTVATSPALSTPPTTLKQTIDLIALVDLARDRVKAGNYTQANDWQKTGSVLTYKSDGKSGKITAPVSLADLRDYEIGVVLRRPSPGTEPFSIDLPVSATKQSTLDLAPRGIELGLVNGQRTKIGDWPRDATGAARILARVRFAPDRRNGSVSVTINNQPAAQWQGALGDMGKSLEFHPDFPSEQLTSIFSYKDSFALDAWQIRVYEGEAKVLRGAGTIAATPSPASPGATPASGKAPVKIFDGSTLKGWRFQGPKEAFVIEDGCIKATGPRGNLMFEGLPGVPPIMKDFDLRMKVKTENQANSGVFVHCRRNNDGVSFGNALELQIANENKDPQKTGSVWGIKPVKDVIVHDGEEFDYRISVRGETVTVFINGTQVNSWTQPNDWKGGPGKPEARLSEGTIGLQSNGGTVWFKDIEVSVP